MSEEWGPWIEHDGKGCPCKGMYVRMQGQNQKIQGPLITREGWADKVQYSWDWETASGRQGPFMLRDGRRAGSVASILRYQVRRPRALLQLIEMVENLPAPAKPRVDA